MTLITEVRKQKGTLRLPNNVVLKNNTIIWRRRATFDEELRIFDEEFMIFIKKLWSKLRGKLTLHRR